MTCEEALNQGIKMTDEYARNDLERYFSRLNGEWIVGKTQKYCDECGQAIDWSDEK